MKPAVSSVVAVGAMLLVSAGCEERRSLLTLPGLPAVPAPAPSPSPAPVPYVDPGFPAAPAGAAVYGRTSPSGIPGSQRYVLDAGGAFSLQYLRPDAGFFEYRGRYSRTGSRIDLFFEDWNRAGPWEAVAVLDRDSRVVQYNLVMMLADFEDGVFTRTHALDFEGGN